MNIASPRKIGADKDAALSFLRDLFGDGATGHMVIWTKQDKRSYWFSADNYETAAIKATKLAVEHDCYFSVGLQEAMLGSNKRGTADTVCSIPGFWFDLDVKSDVHSQEKLPESVDVALEFIADLPLEPTSIVKTGYGVHAYWLFDKNWAFSGDEEHNRAAKLAAGWQEYLINLAREKGWRLDNTSDLSRVLRIPGTLNHKSVEKGFESTPRPVQLLENSTSRYSPEEFAPYTNAPNNDRPENEASNDADNSNKPDLDEIVEGCAWLQHCRDEAQRLPEPEWMAALSIVGRCVDGRELAHEWSSPYPDYDATETDRKLNAALAKAGPWTCKSIREKANGEEYCAGCSHWKKIKSPINHGSDYLPELLERYVYVVGTKRFMDRETHQLLDKEQLSDRWRHRHKGKSSPAITALISPKLEKVDNPTYAPGAGLFVDEEGERRVNEWRPSELNPDPNSDVTPFNEHME